MRKPMHQHCPLRSTARMLAHRRAYMMTYVLGAFPLLIVGGAMVVYLLVQILAGLRVTSTVTSDYATLSDLLGTLRVDTRSAVSAELPSISDSELGDGNETTLVLHRQDETIRYRFAGPRIVRSLQPAGGNAVEHVWTLKRIVLAVSASGATGGLSTRASSVALFHLTVRWPGDDRNALRPDRRFDTAYFVGRRYR